MVSNSLTASESSRNRRPQPDDFYTPFVTSSHTMVLKLMGQLHGYRERESTGRVCHSTDRTVGVSLLLQSFAHSLGLGNCRVGQSHTGRNTLELAHPRVQDRGELRGPFHRLVFLASWQYAAGCEEC